MNQTQDPSDGGTQPRDPGPRLNADSVRELHRLRRSGDDRFVAGIAGGLGRHLGVDPTIIRVLLVALCVVGGAGLLVYAVAWLIVPEEGHDHGLIRLSDEVVKIVLVSVAVIAVLSLLGSGWWWNRDHGVLWPLGIAAVVAAFVVSASRRRHAAPAPAPSTGGTAAFAPADAPATTSLPSPPYDVPPPPATPTLRAAGPPPFARPRRRGPILFWPTIALIAVGSGILGVYAADHHVVAAAWPALALAITGVMLVVGAFVGRPGGLILLGFVLVPPLVVSSVVGSVHWRSQPLDEAPARSADVRSHYAIGNGRLDLDLSRVQDARSLAGRTIAVDMNAGQLVVRLPRGVDTRVDASLGVAGDVQLLDQDQSGFSPHVTELVRDGGAGLAPLVLDVHGRVGHIDIERY